MSWEYIKAEDFCDSVRDGTHDTPKPTMSGHKLVTSKHIKNGQIDPTEAYCISEEDYQVINARSLVEQWDVLMSMIGTVGESAVVKQIPDYAIKNVALFKCGKSEIRGKWLNYYLQSPDARARMLGNMKGSSQQFLSLKQLRALPIPVCDNETMDKIVDILSTYDDLIENNRKQIKLLEEAAQRLYKEWFVDLRFPGHVHTKITDGVPEGWRVTTLDEICSVRKEMLTPEKIDVDTPYIGLEHIPRKDICLSEWGSSSEISSNKFRYYEDDILFGKIRPYFHKVGFALNNGVTSTDAIVLKSTEGLWSLLLMTASSSEFVSYTYQNCKEGAKMPRADWKQMKSYPTIIADRAIQSAFEDQIYTITRKIKVLALQINRLSEARDRLLPKLMSGEVEV